jgi:uncharacterized membrane protein HdeD (DUF308 family)
MQALYCPLTTRGRFHRARVGSVLVTVGFGAHVASNEEHWRRISRRLSAFALIILIVAGIALLVRVIQTGELQFRLLFAGLVVLAIMQALTFRSSGPTDSSGGSGTST